MYSFQMQHWKYLGQEYGADVGIFRLRFDWVENPRNASSLKAVVLELPDWVNVVAVTPEGRIVLVDQYRFGIKAITSEIPAGGVAPDEPPLHAAIRELREETGYTSDDWTYLGAVEPNPAFQNNHCHLFAARNARKTHDPELDEGEAIHVREVTLDALREDIRSGKFLNALGLLALTHVFQIWE